MWPFSAPEPPDLLDAIRNYEAVEKIGDGAPIREILSSYPVKAGIDAFVRADARALSKQRRHQSAGRIAWIAGILGVVVVPLELLPVSALLPWPPQAVNTVRLLALACMFSAIVLLGRKRSRRHWKEARVDAEKMRGDVFHVIIDEAGKRPDHLLQALACFTAAHLKWQLKFYRGRIRELPARLKKEWWRLLPFKLLGYAFSFGASILGSLAVLNFIAEHGPTLPYIEAIRIWLKLLDPSRWQDGLYATAATLLAFAGSRFVTYEDYSNAALYPWAKEELERCELELPEVQKAAADGNVLAVLDFRRRVQKILDREHEVWSGETLPAELRENV